MSIHSRTFNRRQGGEILCESKVTNETKTTPSSWHQFHTTYVDRRNVRLKSSERECKRERDTCEAGREENAESGGGTS